MLTPPPPVPRNYMRDAQCRRMAEGRVFVTLKEAARLVGVPENILLGLAEKNKLPYLCTDNHLIMYPDDALAALRREAETKLVMPEIDGKESDDD